MRKSFLINFTFIILSFLLFSCISLKKFYYLRQNKKDTTSVNKNAPVPPIYAIRPGDMLYIRIFTIDEKISQLFNPINTNLTPGVNEQSAINLNSYLVNDSGYVIIPLLGKILVDSLSLEQTQDKISSCVKIYLSSADVIVKLLSFKVTFLGEFTRPGVYNVYNGKLNILEAIGMAGDFTGYGDKSKVMIIRQIENNKVYTLDLTDRSIIYSDNFYLKPNDIILAEPLKIKRQSLQSSTISTISVLTVSLVNLLILVNYFKLF